MVDRVLLLQLAFHQGEFDRDRMPAEYGGFPTRENVFVQIIQGPVRDVAAARKTYERWFDDVAPDAVGWLASTAGFDDSEFIAIVTFASDEAARRTSQRREQDEWWRKMRQHFSGGVTFYDCPQVATYGDWRRKDSQFVQVVQGRSPNLGELMDRIAAAEQEFVYDHHLDLHGGMVTDHGDGSVSEVIYYPSEDAAHEPENGEVAEELVSLTEILAGKLRDVRCLSLHDPLIRHH